MIDSRCRRRLVRLSLAGAATLALPWVAHGQSVLAKHDGVSRLSWFGASVSGNADVDGDGVSDYIVGAPQEVDEDFNWIGGAYVYSGADHRLLFEKHVSPAPFETPRFGFQVLLTGDLNGDGHSEFAVSAPFSNPATVTVFSGADGDELATLHALRTDDNFGFRMFRAGDVDGDGVPDFGAQALGTAARVYLISGALLDTIAIYQGDVPRSGFGGSGARMGDLDDDGWEDLAIGMPESGLVRIVSTRFGDTLLEIDGGGGLPSFGVALDSIRDLDGDRTRDLIVSNLQSATEDAAVRVISGRTGQVLATLSSPQRDIGFGHSLAVLNDLNGDRVPDFVVGAPADDTVGFFAGSVTFYSGSTLRELYTVQIAEDAVLTGWSVANAGDVNGDGLMDVVIGGQESINSSNEPAGSAWVYAGEELYLNGLPKVVDVGSTLELSLGEGVPSNPSGLFVVDVDGAGPCCGPLGGILPLDGTGRRDWSDVIPPALAGLSLSLQGFSRDAAGRIVASGAETITVR